LNDKWKEHWKEKIYLRSPNIQKRKKSEMEFIYPQSKDDSLEEKNYIEKQTGSKSNFEATNLMDARILLNNNDLIFRNIEQNTFLSETVD
jgi:hypothetical protein